MNKLRYYWLIEDNIVKELKEVCRLLGHFPNQKELRTIKRCDIDNGIRQNNKTLQYYRELLGYRSNKHRGYWLKEENLIKELKLICEKLGHFPTAKELTEKNRSDLWAGLHQHNKPIQHYQKLLGYEPLQKPNGYWTEETLKKELTELTIKIGYFPTQTQLKKLNRADVTKAIDRIGITYHQLQLDLGFMPRSKPKNYWKNWDNLSKEIESIIADERFPTLEMIGSNLSKGAIRAVMNFGGVNEVATKMGYDPPSFITTSDGHMVQSSYEYMLDEWLFSKSISHNYGGLISIKHGYRYDFKLGNGKYIEIWGYEKYRQNNKRCDRYNKKRNIKEQLYKDLDLSLINIESEVFSLKKKEMEEEFERLILL